MAPTQRRLNEQFFDAARGGDKERVLRLIREGADVNVKNLLGETPLHLASRHDGHVKVVKLLLEKGLDVNVTNSSGHTPLHIASSYSKVDLVKLLLEKGADVNANDNDGETPLHYATYNGHAEVAGLLLEKGVDINAINSDGDTALDVAKRGGKESIVKLLISTSKVSENGHTYDRTTQPDQVALAEASHVEVEEWLSKFLNEVHVAKYLKCLVDNGFDSMEILKEVLEVHHLHFMKEGHRLMLMKRLSELRQELVMISSFE